MSVTVLAGGVGAARFLSGLVATVAPGDIAAVVNTGDDTLMHGLTICPDLDTITYTLAGAVDGQRGWGLRQESWRVMSALERFHAVRPADSGAAATWFNLGDLDLATHLYRTARLAEGASLTQVTAEIGRAWSVPVQLLPMCDTPFRTMVTLVDGGEVTFQDYFVRLRHAVAIESIRFDHAATLTAAARRAILDADVVVIAPSNPLVSIAPIRALPEVDELLAERRSTVVAISPIVGGAALKGPADRMLRELGFDSSVLAVAELYRDIAATLVIDHADADSAAEIERAGTRCVVTDTVMSQPDVASRLAATTIAAAR